MRSALVVRAATAREGDAGAAHRRSRPTGPCVPGPRSTHAARPPGPPRRRLRSLDPGSAGEALDPSAGSGPPDPADRSEAEVRAAACSTYFEHRPHPVPPSDLLPTLLADPVTRAGAVIHAVPDADTLLRLAGDPDSEVRAELARHPDLPPSVREALAVDPALSVRVKVFARPDTPEHVRAQIHTSVHELSRSMADPSADADDDERSCSGTRTSRAHGAADPASAMGHGRSLPHIDSPYVAFRVSAALSKALPADAVARLLDDEEEIVRLTMARTAPHLVDPTTAENIERSYRRRDKFTFWWDNEEVLTFPSEALRRFATDPEPRLRSFAPRDPNLPSELAEKLASDPEDRVRRAVAPHRNSRSIPVPTPRRLLGARGGGRRCLAVPSRRAHGVAADPGGPVAVHGSRRNSVRAAKTWNRSCRTSCPRKPCGTRQVVGAEPVGDERSGDAGRVRPVGGGSLEVDPGADDSLPQPALGDRRLATGRVRAPEPPSATSRKCGARRKPRPQGRAQHGRPPRRGPCAPEAAAGQALSGVTWPVRDTTVVCVRCARA